MSFYSHPHFCHSFYKLAGELSCRSKDRTNDSTVQQNTKNQHARRTKAQTNITPAFSMSVVSGYISVRFNKNAIT